MANINLMFHDVFELSSTESGFQGVGPDLYKINKETFEEFVISTLRKKHDFVFTFDDGGSSFYNVIAPILEKYKIKGVFFIATSYIGKAGFLSAEQIIDLFKRGHTIGSHSHSHKRLSELSDAEIYSEWKKSKDILSALLKCPVNTASIPNGYQSDSVLKMADKAGYKYLYTSIPTVKEVHKCGITIIGRFVVTRHTKPKFVNKLQFPCFRICLRFRSSLLMNLQYIMGSYYKKIRNLIFK